MRGTARQRDHGQRLASIPNKQKGIAVSDLALIGANVVILSISRFIEYKANAP